VLFIKTTRCNQKPRPPQLFGQPIQWVKTARYLEVTLDTRVTWLAHINQVGTKAARRLGILGLLLNRRSGLSITKRVLLNKQLICPMMDCTCVIWSSAAHTHVNKLQVLQSQCLRIVTNTSWHISNRQIHEDTGIPFFTDHTRALTESFDSKIANAGNPLVRQLGRHLCQRMAG
jgi:hypothetical protein